MVNEVDAAARLVAPVYSSTTLLAAYPSPKDSRRYAFVVGKGLYQWFYGDTTAADGDTVVDALNSLGRWKLQDQWSSSTSWKYSARVVATSNITLSGTQTIDSVSAVAGDIVLAAGQTAQSENGFYVVSAGAWTRASWFDTSAEALLGTVAFIRAGTSHGSSLWALTSPTSGTINLGVTALVFSKISSAGSATAATQIIAGAGMTGGGDLSADRTLNVVANGDGSIVVNANDIQVGVISDTQHGSRSGGSLHANASGAAAGFLSAAKFTEIGQATIDIATLTGRTLTAGAGLTGGGTLGADRTFNVVANADGSIVVNADDIQVGIISDTQHGTRGGGTLHAAASGSAAGFMSAADFTKLAGSGAVTFATATGSTSLTTPLLAATAGLTINPVSGVVTLQKNGSAALTATLDSAGANTLQFAVGATSVTIDQAQQTSGAGRAWSIRAQRGQAGNIGGDLTIGGGLGGTSNSNLAGNTKIHLGAPASNVSAEGQFVTTNGTVAGFKQTAASTTTMFFGDSAQAAPYSGVFLAPDVTFSTSFVEFAGQCSSASNSVAYSASPTLNCNLSNNHIIGALTGNITTLDMSNIRDGAKYTVTVTQDGTGTKTIGWAAKFVFGDTYTNVPKSAAGSKTIWHFLSDGTNVRCIGKETF